MKSKYSILFSITLQHEYFLNRKCTDFEIIPAEDCLAAFKNLNIQWRQTDDGFIALIKKNEQNQPFINIPSAKYFQDHYGKTVFRFYLKLKNPLFLNYTNIDPAYSDDNKFYFSNRAKNKTQDGLYLSAPIEAFANDKLYLPGNMVADAQSGKVYESLKKYTSKKKSELSDASLWAPKDLRYATGNDIITYSSGSYTFNLTKPAKKTIISVFGFNYNATAPAYDLQVKETVTKTSDNLINEAAVDLSSLSAGKYMIKVNDESVFIYYGPKANLNVTFGVIEIFIFLSGDDDYSLLTKDEQIKPIHYQICFPARRALWKYIRKDDKAKAITDTGNTGYKFVLTNDEFVSSVPIPFSESAVKTLKLEFNTSDFGLFPLSNPTINRLGKCTQNDYDYFCSEINLNY